MSGARLAAMGMVAAVLAVALPAPARADTAPARVASLNLCTDQLAMLIAAPGQLVSISWLARDPGYSAMARAAMDYPINHGRAEELYVLKPDLVLADVWSSAATISMLTRLGIRVEQFTPGQSMEEIRANMLKMGAILGREAEAAALVAAFDARLAALSAPPPRRPRAAQYSANSYTFGTQSLAGQIIGTAGFDNIARETGLEAGGTLPLEVLVMAAPDMLIAGEGAPGESRAEDVLRHPALAGIDHAAVLSGADWSCATPFVLEAVSDLVSARLEWEARE